MKEVIARERLKHECRNKDGEPFVSPYDFDDFIPETVTVEGYDVPLPDIMFAEGRFYLATQTKSDFS